MSNNTMDENFKKVYEFIKDMNIVVKLENEIVKINNILTLASLGNVTEVLSFDSYKFEHRVYTNIQDLVIRKTLNNVYSKTKGTKWLTESLSLQVVGRGDYHSFILVSAIVAPHSVNISDPTLAQIVQDTFGGKTNQFNSFVLDNAATSIYPFVKAMKELYPVLFLAEPRATNYYYNLVNRKLGHLFCGEDKTFSIDL